MAFSESIIVAFYSPYNGLGRTSNVQSMAWSLASKGVKVLVMDWDPQCTLSYAMLFPHTGENWEEFVSRTKMDTIKDALQGKELGHGGGAYEVLRTYRPADTAFPSKVVALGSVNLCVGSSFVEYFNRSPGQSSASDLADNIDVLLPSLTIRRIAHNKRSEVILVDVGGVWGPLAMNLLGISDSLVVCLANDATDSSSIMSMIQTKILLPLEVQCRLFERVCSPPQFEGSSSYGFSSTKDSHPHVENFRFGQIKLLGYLLNGQETSDSDLAWLECQNLGRGCRDQSDSSDVQRSTKGIQLSHFTGIPLAYLSKCLFKQWRSEPLSPSIHPIVSPNNPPDGSILVESHGEPDFHDEEETWRCLIEQYELATTRILAHLEAGFVNVINMDLSLIWFSIGYDSVEYSNVPGKHDVFTFPPSSSSKHHQSTK